MSPRKRPPHKDGDSQPTPVQKLVKHCIDKHGVHDTLLALQSVLLERAQFTPTRWGHAGSFARRLALSLTHYNQIAEQVDREEYREKET